MLSDKELRSALESGKFQLKYAFLPDPDGRFHQLPRPVGPYEEEDARRKFEDSLIRSRVGLSVGPLLRPLVTTGRVPRSVRFAGHKTLVDLRKCEDGWSMAPGESVVAFSNEWLQLPDDIVALIISRVSHYNNGLVVSASYLDSTWEGLVKLHITNFSGRTIRIQLGSELARLFLLPASGGSPDDHSVARQGIHYGITWPRILEDGIDPFPVSSFPREPFASARLRNTNELLKNYAGYGLLTLLILGAAAATQLYYRLNTASSVARRTGVIERTLGDLKSRQLVSGTETVTVKPGARDGISDITLPATLRGHLGSAFVLANVQNADKEVLVSASLVQVGNSPALRLVVHLTRSAQAQTTVNVQWLVAP